jgi:methylmalonyl-CoA/ethylmalonyl-CoA epimerase
MVIDHIGIVVKSIEEALKYWNEAFGYEQMTELVLNTRQKVKVMFLKKQDSLTIKLIEPVDESSPVFNFSRKGGGLHHLCFKCESMEKELRRLKEIGLRIIRPPEPGEAFENEDITFLFAKQGLNIELIDTDKKAKIID